ncbi:hypothetical protein O6H91_22G040200 [Diphasiastrum complanatum]|uniref:Uncharacterized protein n=1 Tax=Diphasiastrum complanatum TaxID=34168 RepID=A0ACC2AEN5_DIPCM|nr:hypothetical protein O6H91_22G040200 [Diphasiastrum complanatum]
MRVGGDTFIFAVADSSLVFLEFCRALDLKREQHPFCTATARIVYYRHFRAFRLFQIVVDASAQHISGVIAVKKQIEDLQGREALPCSQQLLIHQGKVLKDETTMDDNTIIENSFLVVMLTKSKASTTQVSSSSSPTPPQVDSKILIAQSPYYLFSKLH